MNIPKLIKEAHETAVEKGFYDCPDCRIKGYYYCRCENLNCGWEGWSKYLNEGEYLADTRDYNTGDLFCPNCDSENIINLPCPTCNGTGKLTRSIK